jgi:outer membrane protein assembly factor BamB
LIEARNAAMRKAKSDKFKELPALFARFELPEYQAPQPLTAEQLIRYVGQYQMDSVNAEIKTENGKLQIEFGAQNAVVLEHLGGDRFSMNGADVRFELEQDNVISVIVSFSGNEIKLKPVSAMKKSVMNAPADASTSKDDINMEPDRESVEIEQPIYGPSSEASLAADRAISSPNWPSFRGTGARGVAEGQSPPIKWAVSEDSDNNQNVKWSARVPGLGLSSPVIWGDRIYLTSAVSDEADNQLKIGLYGDVASVNETVEYAFVLYCLDKSNGDLLWSKTCKTAIPSVKRHAKSSHANPTVAANENHVVAFFGSEGLYCFDHQGNEVWSKDLGFLDSGWFYDASYQWGFGSSPIIFEDQVIVQCDIQENSFIAAFDLRTGEELWRTERDEIPGWSTPTVYQFDDLPMLITHATKSARGYDARNGELLWSVGKHSEIVVPTPFVAHDLIFIASGYSPIQPIVAIRPTARGNFGLKSEEYSEQVAWSTQRNGPYMPTPIVYGDYLYVCSNAGVLTCYYAKTGTEVYKKRMTARGGSLAFTASPVAADGHLYFAAEDGRVLVVKAGPEYDLVATNPSGGSILATPAISEGVFFVRTSNRLMAFQQANSE